MQLMINFLKCICDICVVFDCMFFELVCVLMMNNVNFTNITSVVLTVICMLYNLVFDCNQKKTGKKRLKNLETDKEPKSITKNYGETRATA